MTIYAIGGLGVDERVFSELVLDFELVPLSWIDPLPSESLEGYTRRFAKQINSDNPFSIIGVSFGGMIAIELNKLINPRKIVLISSATNKHDIPLSFRIMGKAGLFPLLPGALMKPPNFLANWFFGVQEPKYRKVLHDIISDTQVDFLRWATNEIAHWNNKTMPVNMVRIHGSSDRLLRYSKSEKVIVVEKAGHFMVMNRAKKISKILNDVLSESEWKRK